MTSDFSVLSKFTQSHLYLEPYPHIIIDDALSDLLAEELRRTFPSAHVVGCDDSKNNERWSYSAADSSRDERVSQVWRSMIGYHTSPAFWSEVRQVFGSLLEANITKSRNLGCLAVDARVGIRGRNDFESHDILLEAQISGNTPTTSPSSVRRTHLDEGNKVFSGLLYLRDEDDKSRGGELIIQRWKRWVPNNFKSGLYFEGMKDVVKDVKRVPYRHNTLIIFLDSFDALHAVSTRHATSFTRKFMNLDGILPVHEYEFSNPNLLARIRRKVTTERS